MVANPHYDCQNLPSALINFIRPLINSAMQICKLLELAFKTTFVIVVETFRFPHAQYSREHTAVFSQFRICHSFKFDIHFGTVFQFVPLCLWKFPIKSKNELQTERVCTSVLRCVLKTKEKTY